MMKSIFSFFKAGQGSFYGGRILDLNTNKVFTVVYDCGTTNFISGNTTSLNNEITRFKNFPEFPHSNNNDIDLLFISHLDFDHVSGLKRLLSEFNVKKIILPYISKKHRQFFLVSISDDNPSDDSNFDLSDYIDFINSPHNFINSKSENTNIFYINSDTDKKEIEYQGYDNENQSDDIYTRGTTLDKNDFDELKPTKSTVYLFKNNLQFFIQKKWEFTTYVKDVNSIAINNLHKCLKKLVNNNNGEFNFDDLKSIVTKNRKKSHNCYTKNIGEINSHGLVLLHGPIRFHHLFCNINSDCEISSQNFIHPHYCNSHHHYRQRKTKMLGTLLFGDTSLKLNNNPVNFPKTFRNKLESTHIVQVPHHGSSKNWDFNEFDKLKIGKSFYWNNKVIAVCNFGYGNKFGHPSNNVLKDLSSSIFLNSQFSRLNIRYEIIEWI